jgi:hypothetical protein
MKLWIARDKSGSLYLFKKKPVLVTFDGVEVFDSNEEYFEIDSHLYSSVTVENSPQQVEIKLIEDE